MNSHNNKIKNKNKYLFIIFFILVFSALPLVLNICALKLLRKYPYLSLSLAEKVNENTRTVREKMIPSDKIAEWYDLNSKDDLRPMWEEFYTGGAEFESYVHFRSCTKEGRFYGVMEGGYRKVKNQGPWPPNDENINIFFFGGSTTFGVGPYWATIPSYLQEIFDEKNKKSGKKKIKIYNFGRSGYMLGQESVLLERLLANGIRPNFAIFFDGLNEFAWPDGNPSSWQTLATYFNEVNKKALDKAAGKINGPEWSILANFFESLPFNRLLKGITSYLVSKNETPQYKILEEIKEQVPETEMLNGIITRYLNLVKIISGKCKENKVKAIFFIQPIPTYKYNTKYHLFKPDRLGNHINSKFGYSLLRKKINKKTVPIFWLADIQEDKKENLYIDAFHYTAPFCREISEKIFNEITEKYKDEFSK